MISICIPVFNYDIRRLVRELHSQLSTEGIESEILIADDASQKAFVEINKDLTEIANVIFFPLSQNRGRAGIRNFLASQARFPYLLFLDSDTLPVDIGFVNNYLKAASENEVCCGGIRYRNEKPEKSRLLRWKFGRKREEIPASIRNQQPYKSFMTGNFLCPAQVFKEIGFDESLKSYGHEDTLFGLDLQKKGVGILHIENPVFHEGLESNDVFLNKTETAIKNLLIISEKPAYDTLACQNIKLLNTCLKIRNAGLLPVLKILSFPVLPLLRFLLLKNLAGIRCLDMYKLLFSCRLMSVQH